MASGTRVLVFNGWAAGREAWDLCTFERDWLFDYIEQLDGLPERVMAEFDSVVLVGFSMGSTTALRLLLAEPRKVRGLVLVSGTPRMTEDRATGWRGLSPRRVAALEYGTRMAFADDPSPVYEPRNLRRGLDYLGVTDLRAQLVELAAASLTASLPVRVVHSERDGIVRPENVVFFQSVFPQAAVKWVPGNEHVLPVTAHAAVDAAVREVLK